MNNNLTYVGALADRRLLGALPAFRDLSTWRRWMVFLKALEGLPLNDEELAIFCHHTGRSRYTPPPAGFREAAAIVGRQAGKDRIGSVIQVVDAIRGEREPDGTELYALSIAQDHRSAMRTAFSYACSPFERVPVLASAVTRRTATAWELDNGVVLGAYPCRPAAVRGLRARVVVCSELAFFRNSDNAPVDVEMLRALRPCLATTNGRLIILSSPYGQAGALWDLHRNHFGQDDSPFLIWQATAPEMNPTLPADYLLRMEADDPDAYRSEVLGEFRAGMSLLLDAEAIDPCIDRGVLARPRQPGLEYHCFVDASSGAGRDKFATAVGHMDGEVAVLDTLLVRRPPFNPSDAIAESAALAKSYGCHGISADRYAIGFVQEGYRSHGLQFSPSELDRSAIYLAFVPMVLSRRVSLLDQAEMLRELRGLERHRGPAGRDRVDHPRGRSDDEINSAAGVLTMMTAAPLAHITFARTTFGTADLPIDFDSGFARTTCGSAGWDAIDEKSPFFREAQEATRRCEGQ